MPCQWMEVSSSNLLVTRMVTVSPSRQCKVGAGNVPFTVVAFLNVPVILTSISEMVKSNSVPLSIWFLGAVSFNNVALAHVGKFAKIPLATMPATKRRRERLGGLCPELQIFFIIINTLKN